MNGAAHSALPLKAVEKAQAESFFKVMVVKKFDVEQMADVMEHMGKMLVAYAEDIDAKRMPQ